VFASDGGTKLVIPLMCKTHIESPISLNTVGVKHHRQLLGSQLQVFLQRTGLYQLSFFRRRLPRCLSFSFSHVDARFCLHWHLLCMEAPLPTQLHFLQRPRMWCESGSGCDLQRSSVSWFAGRVAVAPVWSSQVSSKPTFTTQIKESQRHCMPSKGDLVSMPRNFPPFC